MKTETVRTGANYGEQITYTYNYDSTFVHRLVSSSNGATKETFTYDDVGNNTGTVLSGNSGSQTISSSSAYTNNGNLLASVTDAAGNLTAYSYANYRNQVLGQPSAITDAKGTGTSYTLDTYGRTQKVSLANIANIQYTYSRNILTQLERTAGTASQVYRFAYDGFGNSTAVSIGEGANDRTLATYNTKGMFEKYSKSQKRKDREPSPVFR